MNLMANCLLQTFVWLCKNYFYANKEDKMPEPNSRGGKKRLVKKLEKVLSNLQKCSAQLSESPLGVERFEI